jgi:hypothetical protein
MATVVIIVRVVRMADYYDYVLGFVPLTLVGLTAVLSAVGVDLLVAVPVGASLAGLAVGHALFVNGPDGRRVGAVEESPVHSTAADRRPIDAD